MAFGIDFGTTNSAVVYDNARLGVKGNRPFPSVVAIHNLTGEVLCGMEAHDRHETLLQNNYCVIKSIKRFLGTEKTWIIAGREWTPEDVAVELLKAIKSHADSQTHLTKNNVLSEAAVAIPVGWSSKKRGILRRAAERAGIVITDFVSEPTAAFIKCRASLPACEHVIVFDWGGGTLDVSVIVIRNDQIEELATEGLDRAGDDVDKCIAECVHRKIFPNSDIRFDQVSSEHKDALLMRCETAKISLSLSKSKQPQPIVLTGYAGKDQVTLSLEEEVLDSIVEPFIQQAIATLETAIKNANISRNVVDKILLVGGTSGLKSLRSRLEQMFPGKIYVPPQVEWAIADGASQLADNPGSYRLMQKVCLVLADDSIFNLVQPGDKFGITKNTCCLGLVEKSKEAQLIFAESIDGESFVAPNSILLRNIGYLNIPSCLFYYEKFTITAELTNVLTLRISGKSDHGIENDQRCWEYDKLRFVYDIRKA